MNGSLGVAAGLGFVTGLRTMQGVAWVARELSSRRRRPRDGIEAWLADGTVARALGVLAVGELIGDKLPGMPDRTQPAPFLGRQVVGAIVGAVAAGDDHRITGAAVGAGAAAVGGYVGWFLRREAARATMLPDPAVAVVEDTVAVLAARELAREV